MLKYIIMPKITFKGEVALLVILTGSIIIDSYELEISMIVNVDSDRHYLMDKIILMKQRSIIAS